MSCVKHLYKHLKHISKYELFRVVEVMAAGCRNISFMQQFLGDFCP